MQGGNFHRGGGGGGAMPLSFGILFPVLNTETEIGFNSLIIGLVLVSHHAATGLDERTQLGSPGGTAVVLLLHFYW